MMAKKKKKPQGDAAEPTGQGSRPTPKRPRPRAKPGSAPRKRSPDWREVEVTMWRMLGREAPPDETEGSPRGRAAEILHRAFGAVDGKQVVALARQALEAWPDCADAYVLLAENARSPKEAADLYAKGVEAGARDLGETAFREAAGMFWGILPTRPYMRARLGLAQALWVLGRRDDSIRHYQEMLRLNPGDNQGVRYRLAASLIDTGRDEDLAALIEHYRDDASATWAFSAALLTFRREGDTPRSRKALAAARKVNKFVPEYLTGRTMLPSHLPDAVGRGDRNEAIDYVAGFLNGWRSTPGALDWLRRSGTRGRPKPAPEPPPQGPTRLSKARLARLPESDEVWQADARLLPIWVNVPDDPRRPWVVVVASLTDGLILGQQVSEVEPSPAFLWDTLTKVMTDPAEGDPRRPSAVEVGRGESWSSLSGHLDDIGVAFEAPEPLELIDDVVRHLVEHVTGRPPMPGLLEMPGMTPALVAGFYRAAADFYRKAPWQKVGGAETIKVATDRFESGPWYAVIIGQMGMTLGVALYDDLESLLRIRDGDASDEQNARETVALSVTYGRETEVAVTDLDDARRHGWEVAAPDAYPAPVRKERGLMMRPPLAWELQLLEASLRAMPDFVTEHDRDDPAPYTREVPTSAGPLKLSLSWVNEIAGA
jgi:tetratricopeptide (TPR) repeat protein